MPKRIAVKIYIEKGEYSKLQKHIEKLGFYSVEEFFTFISDSESNHIDGLDLDKKSKKEYKEISITLSDQDRKIITNYLSIRSTPNNNIAKFLLSKASERFDV